MSGLPALDRVLAQLQAIVAAEPDLDGWTVEMDRPADDDFARGELPHLNIVHTGTSFTQRTHSETLNRAEVDLTFTVPSDAAALIGPRLRFVEAALIGILFRNRTLGGFVEDIDPIASTGGEEQRAETGQRTLTTAILFVTPVGDQFTLIGATGLIP